MVSIDGLLGELRDKNAPLEVHSQVLSVAAHWLQYKGDLHNDLRLRFRFFEGARALGRAGLATAEAAVGLAVGEAVSRHQQEDGMSDPDASAILDAQLKAEKDSVEALEQVRTTADWMSPDDTVLSWALRQEMPSPEGSVVSQPETVTAVQNLARARVDFHSGAAASQGPPFVDRAYFALVNVLTAHGEQGAEEIRAAQAPAPARGLAAVERTTSLGIERPGGAGHPAPQPKGRQTEPGNAAILDRWLKK
ncbi:MAG: hypothetical protein HOU01_16820 [Streptomycetaceae bacterium]|nr:hypothetical protein [Streptomycetaceae bacterium]